MLPAGLLAVIPPSFMQQMERGFPLLLIFYPLQVESCMILEFKPPS
jgi:hypothetical protein